MKKQTKQVYLGTLPIGASQVHVFWVPDKDNGETLGTYDMRQQQIAIFSGTTRAMRLEVLMHEVGHAIFQNYALARPINGRWDYEELADVVAKGIGQCFVQLGEVASRLLKLGESK